MNPDLSTLTPGERLWLWRRGQFSPTGRTTGRGGRRMSAQEASVVLCIRDVTHYSAAENDVNGAATLLPTFDAVLQHIQPTLGDLCLIARRRSGEQMADLCTELMISRPTFNKLERLGHPDIVDLWLRKGFVFPETSDV